MQRVFVSRRVSPFGARGTSRRRERPGDDCTGHLDELPQCESLRIEIGSASLLGHFLAITIVRHWSLPYFQPRERAA